LVFYLFGELEIAGMDVNDNRRSGIMRGSEEYN